MKTEGLVSEAEFYENGAHRIKRRVLVAAVFLKTCSQLFKGENDD